MKYFQTLKFGTSTAALVAGMAMASAVGYVTPAAAQGASAAGVEAVVVTGSRVARTDADSVGPLTTLTTKDIESTASASIGDILQKLPDAGVSYNGNGAQGTSFGTSSISLRYLANTDGDADRTLVLVDGHRWVDGTGARGIRDFVDLNTIPIGMIGGVEILQDGASAIYGADAIAGVVNIHTRKDVDGLSISAKVGDSSRSDGQEYSIYANYGIQLPHGSIYLSASFVDDEPVYTYNRDITKTALTAGLNNLATAPASPRGLYVLPGFSTTAAPITQNVGVTVATGPASYHVATLPGDYYDQDTQGVSAMDPEKRFGLYGRITNDLGSDITLTVDALFNRRTSEQIYSPQNLSIGGTGGTNKGFNIAANQQYNPFGVAFTPTQAWNISIFTTQLGGRNQFEGVDNYRFSAGLDGTLNVFGDSFKWNLFGSYARNDMRFRADGGTDLEKLYFALQSPAVCAAQPGCIPVNIFGQMTPDQANSIRNIQNETNSTQLFDATFDVTGTLFKLPAGDVGAAFGIEVRRNTGEDNPDTYDNTLSTGSGNLPLPATTTPTTQAIRTPTSNGAINVREAYLEMNIPILKDMPLAKSLDLDLATRISDYDTVGSHITSKVGIGYRPIEDLLLRGTFSQGFRAPSLIELYAGQKKTNLAGTGTDPCNGGAAAHPTLPGCAGIPATYNQNLYNSGLLPEILSGNPALKPEKAETFSYGFAYKPNWLDGFSLTSDWYQVNLYNAISQPAAANALSLCAAQAGTYCNFLTRDATTGQVLQFLQSYQNLNKIKTSGVDSTARYDFSTDFGDFDTMLSATFLDRFTTISPNPAGGAPIVTNAAGTSTGGTVPATTRSTYPHWKASASIGWTQDAISILWRARYIGSTKDGAAPALPVIPVKNGEVSEIWYNDLQAGYTFDEQKLNVTVGVNNIFDQMPPAAYADAPINFDMYTYDVMGRYFFLRVNKSF